MTEPKGGSPGDGGPARTGLALLECAACSQGGELRQMEFHLSETSPPRPCLVSFSQRVLVLSLPALPCLVWVLLGAAFPPCPGCRQACESGDTSDLHPHYPHHQGGAQIRLAQLFSSAVLRATCIFDQIEWSAAACRGPEEPGSAWPEVSCPNQAVRGPPQAAPFPP